MKDRDKTRNQFIGGLSGMHCLFTGMDKTTEKLQAAFDAISDAVCLLDNERRIAHCNPAMARLIGKSTDEVIGRTCWELVHGTQEPVQGCPIVRSWQTLERETMIQRIGGHLFEESVYPILNGQRYPIAAVHMISNITERKQKEESHQTIIKTALDGFWLTNLEGKFLEVNGSYCGMVGYTQDELLNMSIMDIEAEENPEDTARRIKKIVETGSDRFLSRHRCKSGDIIDVEVSVNYLGGAGEERLFVFVRDVTERKKAEAAFKESETKYRMLVERLHAGVYQADRDGTFLTMNTSGAKILGFDSAEQVVGKYRTADFYPDLSVRRQKIPGLNEEGFAIREMQLKRRDGSLIWVLANINSRHKENGDIIGYEGTFAEITERKRLEEEYRKVAKLESLGVLAGGIAHDFNNLLTGVIGNISLMKFYVQTGDKIYNLLQEAEKASLRTRGLTKQLLTFARGGAPVKKTADIAELVRETAGFVLRGSGVKCEFSMPDDLWGAEVDEGLISQVIHNLVINADEAMRKMGVLNVRARNIIIGEHDNLPLPGGRYIEIELEDHGTGIAAEDMSRIFDPYFTTKVGGSGLGLTAAYSIVRDHQGYIAVESEPGVGSTFRFYLPVMKGKEMEERVKTSPKEGNTEGGARILVMDDEEMIRMLLEHALTLAGYEVEVARDGSEAVKCYQAAKEEGRPFDLVILDLTVPGGMGGKEAIKRLLEVDPEVKAIVSSGYADDLAMAHFRDYGFKAVARKPFTVPDLRRIVGEVLSR
ncbi:MAG: PAS domain S-box protein [Syntrophales bacterium]